MIATLEWTNTIISGLLASIGAIGGIIVAVYKMGPEKGSIVVKTAEGVVLMQTGLIKELRAMLDEAKDQLAACRILEDKMQDIAFELAQAKVHVAQLTAQLGAQIEVNEDLKERIKVLEGAQAPLA